MAFAHILCITLFYQGTVEDMYCSRYLTVKYKLENKIEHNRPIDSPTSTVGVHITIDAVIVS